MLSGTPFVGGFAIEVALVVILSRAQNQWREAEVLVPPMRKKKNTRNANKKVRNHVKELEVCFKHDLG